jgi:hypothetical protein
MEAEKTEIVKISFDKYYLQYLYGVIIMMKYKFYHENLLAVKERENTDLAKENAEFCRENETLTRNLSAKTAEIESVVNSRSFKIGRAITAPVRIIKRGGKNE